MPGAGTLRMSSWFVARSHVPSAAALVSGLLSFCCGELSNPIVINYITIPESCFASFLACYRHCQVQFPTTSQTTQAGRHRPNRRLIQHLCSSAPPSRGLHNHPTQSSQLRHPFDFQTVADRVSSCGDRNPPGSKMWRPANCCEPRTGFFVSDDGICVPVSIVDG